MEEYLRSTEVIDCDSRPIKDKSYEITKEAQTDREKAVALFYFVRDKIKHDPYAPGYSLEDYRASVTLNRGYGFCSHKGILLTALARAAGIPARPGFVDIRDHLLSPKFLKLIGGDNLLIYHGYAELFIDGKWLHASPAYDLEKCQQNGFIPVEFDGTADAKDSPFNIKGEPHIEHVCDHGTYQDFPWDEITRVGREFWANLGMDFDEMVGGHWGKKDSE